MAVSQAPEEWTEWADLLAEAVDGRSRWRLPLMMLVMLVMLGMLFAGSRRTVTTGLRAGGLQDDHWGYYDLLQTVGHRWMEIGDLVLELIVKRVLTGESRALSVIDDTPTKRYGPQVAGAEIHHDPTSGPTKNEFCYGHVRELGIGSDRFDWPPGGTHQNGSLHSPGDVWLAYRRAGPRPG